MHLKWNRAFSRVLASSVAVLMASTSLYAIPRDPCEPPAPPVCCEEPKPGPFAFSYPFDMDLNCPRDFYFHADALAMQAKQDGMDFAIQDSNGATSDFIAHGRVEGFSNDHRDWDWNPGMRIGAGFYLNHDAWNLDFNWTWLNITNYKTASVGTNGGQLIPLYLTGTGTPAALLGPRASANWHAAYNTIDVRLGKPYYVSRYLVLNPHFGVRGAWIRQHFSVDYGGSTATANNRTVHHGDNDFWGVGSRAGVDSEWLLGKGWKLFGNVAASMLFGKFDIEQNLNYGTGTGSTNGFDLDYDFYQNTPNFEMILGVGWGTHFSKRRYHVALDLAYEFHEWFDQLNMRRFYSGANFYANDVVSRGNLTLNGVSFRLQFDM